MRAGSGCLSVREQECTKTLQFETETILGARPVRSAECADVYTEKPLVRCQADRHRLTVSPCRMQPLQLVSSMAASISASGSAAPPKDGGPQYQSAPACRDMTGCVFAEGFNPGRSAGTAALSRGLRRSTCGETPWVVETSGSTNTRRDSLYYFDLSCAALAGIYVRMPPFQDRSATHSHR